ncbi:MAG: DUF433 domain-containing protein [Candidatus Methanoperedens sp.]|nr:DUF433 domain-containing protein [Candidatus Methanoperedens sp.]
MDLILEKLAYGYTEKKLEDEYPFITKEDIQAVLLYASKAISMEEEILLV